jgi:gamma-glutamyltranspeptidase/glutathione hydrolase
MQMTSPVCFARLAGGARLLCCLLLAACLLPASARAQSDQPEISSGFTAKETAHGKSFMIAAAHPLAVAAGYEVLKEGGSAVDAAIAAEMVLGLVEGQASSIGGDAAFLHWDNKAKKLSAIDGRAQAPAAADEQLFYDQYGERLGRKEAGYGGLAVGTPSLLRVLERAHKRHGKLPWARLMQPAIKLAAGGFPVSHRLHTQIAANDRIRENAAARAYFFDADGKPHPVGHILVNKPLAALMTRIAKDGAKAFYDSDIPDRIADAVQSAERNPGRLSAADIHNYRPRDAEPVCGPYRGHKVCGMPPPYTGGLIIAMALRMLERFDLKALGPDDAKAHHLIVEATRLAYADRTRYIADPAFTTVPVAGMLDGNYLFHRSEKIDEAARSRVRAGDPPPYSKDRPAKKQEGDDSPEPPSTTHISVVDADGNAVALTASLGLGFGTGLMVDGFLLNSQLRSFGFNPESRGRPNINRPESNKRPRSSQSPTIVFRPAGSPRLVLGSPGGGRIVDYVLATIIAVLDWEMDVGRAAALPHVLPRRKWVEIERDTAAEKFKEALSGYGHDVKTRRLTSGLHAIEIAPDGLTGGADPRREGVAHGE